MILFPAMHRNASFPIPSWIRMFLTNTRLSSTPHHWALSRILRIVRNWIIRFLPISTSLSIWSTIRKKPNSCVLQKNRVPKPKTVTTCWSFRQKRPGKSGITN